MVKMVQNAYEMKESVKKQQKSMKNLTGYSQKVENLQKWLDKKDFEILNKNLGGYRPFRIQP